MTTSFIAGQQEIIKKPLPQSGVKLWLNTLVFSLIVFLLLSAYLFLRRPAYNLDVINSVFATTGVVLIGLSFALSGLCYFFNFIDAKIVYRKYFGLAGFAFALAHAIVSLFFMSEILPFPDYYLEKNHLAPFLSAIIALLIFTLMSAISNRYAIHQLGGQRWRALLRVGYIGFIFAIFHFALIKYKGWLNWIRTLMPSAIPPLSLIIFIFAIFVLVLRLALFFTQRRAKNITKKNFTPLSL